MSLLLRMLPFALPFMSCVYGQTTLNDAAETALKKAGFTGAVQASLERRLGRSIDTRLVNLGRLLWFDNAVGLASDNSCAGCHSPANGFGDSQSIAIGVQNNNTVGPNRSGPRNQRRSPTVINTAFYPNLMWNGRFSSVSGNPFDTTAGVSFPPPEGSLTFLPLDPTITHLLIAQAHVPPTELPEMAGFSGTAGTIGPEFNQFDDGRGLSVPAPDASGYRNEAIRQAVLARLNSIPGYRRLFGQTFDQVAKGGQIDFTMFSRAIAEFEFTLVFADAPVDRFARGDRSAMTERQKKGLLIFFGKGRCVACHAVSTGVAEMFSDFRMHVAAIPQIAPVFGAGKGNVVFDGPGQDEDFGLEQVTGKPADRYKFRTSPLRNLALQAAFFHNGAFRRLEDAIRYHLDATSSARTYNPISAGLDPDLTYRMGPFEPMLARLDPLLADPVRLTGGEFASLVAFLRDGLLDARASRKNLCELVPDVLPSGLGVTHFHRCAQ